MSGKTQVRQGSVMKIAQLWLTDGSKKGEKRTREADQLAGLRVAGMGRPIALAYSES